MALNITFDGYAYDSTSTLSAGNIYYQALFYPNGTASSSAAWNAVSSVETSGYYNINLGDSTWIGQEGTALSGAKVLIVFWIGDTSRLADCGALSEWGAFEIVLDGSSTYTNNAQTMPNIAPTISWTYNTAEHPYAHMEYTFTNSSDDIHSWVFGSTTMCHWYVLYGEYISSVNTIVTTDYTWGDSTSSSGLSGAASANHVWDAAGDYTVTMDIEDACGATATGTVDIRVYWRPPVPTLSRCDSVGNVLSSTVPDPDTPIYFKYTGTNNDNVIVSILWTIEDEGDYGNTTTVVSGSATDIVAHSDGLGTDWLNHTATPLAFTNPGAHIVTTTITWFDGFENQTIVYSDTITQEKFSGPALNFSQAPAQATVSSSVSLTNTSTSVDRVGLGLPDGDLYTWTWSDDGTTSSQTDVDHSYEFVKVPQTTACYTTLCAEWSDGWDTHTTCLTKDIVFATAVTVTAENCYYLINVTGTSSDGTAIGYGWTVSSGTSASGTWQEVWQSPVGENQQSKTICFSSVGWYKIEGFVYGTGTTTSAYETLYIDETCPGSSITCPIWDGTGALDTRADWVRTGYGTESAAAMYEGTNGLNVTGATSSDVIVFHTDSYMDKDICDYDFLSFWINIRSWQKGTDLSVKLYSSNTTTAPITTLRLSYYLHFGLTKEWQRVMIPLQKFNIPRDTTQTGWPMYVNKLEFNLVSGVSFWLDNVALTMGDLIMLPVCGTNQETFEIEEEADVAGMISTTIHLPTPSIAGHPPIPGQYPAMPVYPYSTSYTRPPYYRDIDRDIKKKRPSSRPTVNPFPNPRNIE